MQPRYDPKLRAAARSRATWASRTGAPERVGGDSCSLSTTDRDGPRGETCQLIDAKNLPQVVLLDLNLPKVGGIDVLRAIRENEETKLLPVVILTSPNEDKDLQGSHALGANRYVV